MILFVIIFTTKCHVDKRETSSFISSLDQVSDVRVLLSLLCHAAKSSTYLSLAQSLALLPSSLPVIAMFLILFSCSNMPKICRLSFCSHFFNKFILSMILVGLPRLFFCVHSLPFIFNRNRVCATLRHF